MLLLCGRPQTSILKSSVYLAGWHGMAMRYTLLLVYMCMNF